MRKKRHSGALVTDKHRKPVDVQNDNQEVFNGEEDQHLVDHIEVDHDSETDQQERPVLDKQSFHSAPDLSPDVGEQRGRRFWEFFWGGSHDCWTEEKLCWHQLL